MSHVYNGSSIEMRLLNNAYREFCYELPCLMTTENRRKGIQCPAFDLKRKYQTVYQQGALPYTEEGRKTFTRLVHELEYAVFHFDRRFEYKKPTPEPIPEEEPVVEPSQRPSRLRRFIRWVFSRG